MIINTAERRIIVHSLKNILIFFYFHFSRYEWFWVYNLKKDKNWISPIFVLFRE